MFMQLDRRIFGAARLNTHPLRHPSHRYAQILLTDTKGALLADMHDYLSADTSEKKNT